MSTRVRVLALLGLLGLGLAAAIGTHARGSAPAQQGANHLYFNSREPGCGTDPDVILCDDFEDGDWYTKDCDSAGRRLREQDGWCGTIYNAAGLAAGTARCNGAGFRSECAATTGVLRGSTGNMADIALKEAVSEVWVRFYTKPLAGYQFGAEKALTFNDGQAGDNGIKWGNFAFRCGSGTASSTGGINMGFPAPAGSNNQSVCANPNQGGFSVQSGNWYFVEIHYMLNTPGQNDGVFELWMDSCGPDGNSCPVMPTLRMRYPGTSPGLSSAENPVRVNPRTNANERIRVLWFESWANPTLSGERYWDQIKVAKVGPIGFLR